MDQTQNLIWKFGQFAYWNYLQLHKPDYVKCLENSD